METEHEEEQEHHSDAYAFERHRATTFFVFTSSLPEDDLLDEAEHVCSGENQGETSHESRERTHVPQSEEHGEFTDKASRTRNSESHHAGKAKERREHRIFGRKTAKLIKFARTRHAFCNTHEVELSASRNAVSNEQHEHSRKHSFGEAEHACHCETQVAHGAESEEFFAIRCAESHESAVNCSEEAKPHHAGDSVHRKRENREDPDDKAKHASLTHCTREDC